MTELLRHPIFRADHYAGTTSQKIRRSLELGPLYYLSGVPRYWSERRRSQLASRGPDLEVLVNPLYEAGILGNATLTPPPGLDDVLDQLRAAGMVITMKKERFLAVCSQWWRTTQGDATIIECGSYRGTTGLALALLGREHGFDQQVNLFDLFGKPVDMAFLPIDGTRQANEFALAPDYADQLRALAVRLGVGDRITIHAGLFEHTFPQYVSGRLPLRFVHVDANLYESTKQACAFVKPLLTDGSTVVFDDYHGITDLGARLAIDEIFVPANGAIKRLWGTSAVLDYKLA